ncbi:hypothetical protein KY284_037941 [Solanum tuberosum]|nr:hypothetical protein KY284_037941 [Solanum tuberosum]
MKPTNIERLLKTPIEELKYHELEQLEELLDVALEKLNEALAKLQKECSGVFHLKSLEVIWLLQRMNKIPHQVSILVVETKKKPTNIERLLKTPTEELKCHELQQLEELPKVAMEKAEGVVKLQKECGVVFPYEIFGSDLTPLED